jgi:hypothetical protein
VLSTDTAHRQLKYAQQLQEALQDYLALRNYPTTAPRQAEAGDKTQAKEPEWSKADSPAKWAKRFGLSTKTFTKRVKDGTIRAKQLSDRLYQIALSDLPKTASS